MIDLSEAKIFDVLIDCLYPESLKILFSRLPDRDVVADILTIQNQPHFEVRENSETEVEIFFKPELYSKGKLAEILKNSFEKHGLLVSVINQEFIKS